MLSVNPLNVRLGHVAVVPITGTSGSALTHVPLTSEAGLTRYDESYADSWVCSRSRERASSGGVGFFAQGELAGLADQIHIYLKL